MACGKQNTNFICLPFIGKLSVFTDTSLVRNQTTTAVEWAGIVPFTESSRPQTTVSSKLI